MNLDRLFRPTTVAVYGGKWSDYVFEQCKKTAAKGQRVMKYLNKRVDGEDLVELKDFLNEVIEVHGFNA